MLHTLLHVVAQSLNRSNFWATIPNISFVPWSPKRSATMLDLNNIAADRYHKGPLRKQFPPLVMASEDRDTPITNNHGDTNSSSQWIDTIAWWRPVERGRNVTITIYVTIVRQTINETFNIHIILASPQTSFGVRSSRIHFSSAGRLPLPSTTFTYFSRSTKTAELRRLEKTSAAWKRFKGITLQPWARWLFLSGLFCSDAPSPQSIFHWGEGE